MTPSKALHGQGTDLLQAPIPLLDLAQPTIPFQRLPIPDMDLTFLPRPFPSESRKRGRAAADIDGEHSCPHKKKRRLRLFLITSRLSPQFSHPATNIVDRGSSKIAVWAKQKNLGRNLLRKAAILNRIRRSAVAAREEVSRRRLLVEQEKEERQLEMARLTFNYGAINTYTRPVHLQPSTPPSAALQNKTQYLLADSLRGTPTGSPATSRSPPPSSTSPPLKKPGLDASSDYKSPNAAYALSPPRAQPSTRTYEPHLPSPLGLSNYDAFDGEELGAKDHTATDLYSYSDNDDDEEDRYSYPWDEVEDGRHDSPFSPSVVTNDFRTTANTGTNNILKTPPQAACDEFDVAETLFSGLKEGDGESADSLWPSPFLGAKMKDTTKTGGRGSSPNFRALDAGPLAVQYPGAPVPYTEQLPVTTAPVLPPNLVPASMSPNFLPADSVGWPEVDRRERQG